MFRYKTYLYFAIIIALVFTKIQACKCSKDKKNPKFNTSIKKRVFTNPIESPNKKKKSIDQIMSSFESPQRLPSEPNTSKNLIYDDNQGLSPLSSIIINKISRISLKTPIQQNHFKLSPISNHHLNLSTNKEVNKCSSCGQFGHMRKSNKLCLNYSLKGSTINQLKSINEVINMSNTNDNNVEILVDEEVFSIDLNEAINLGHSISQTINEVVNFSNINDNNVEILVDAEVSSIELNEVINLGANYFSPNNNNFDTLINEEGSSIDLNQALNYGHSYSQTINEVVNFSNINDNNVEILVDEEISSIELNEAINLEANYFNATNNNLPITADFANRKFMGFEPFVHTNLQWLRPLLLCLDHLYQLK